VLSEWAKGRSMTVITSNVQLAYWKNAALAELLTPSERVGRLPSAGDHQGGNGQGRDSKQSS
jgi:hypothetical protein